jgi:hypothetical protein
MASLVESTHDSFDKELWKKCCQEYLVAYVTKASPEYPLVLKKYRDTVAMRKSPEYIQMKKEQEEKQRVWLEWTNSEEYKQHQKDKAAAYRKQKEDEKKWLHQARESMSWGT